MGELNRVLKRTIKKDAQMTATVVDVINNRASVRIGTNGAIVRNIKIVGGSVNAGDTVVIDMKSVEPVVQATYQQTQSSSITSRATLSSSSSSESSSATQSQIVNEDLSSQCDNTTTEFSLSKSYVKSSLCIYMNGTRLKPEIDFTENDDVIIFTSAPISGDIVIADYRS